jgi:hypothetical protein
MARFIYYYWLVPSILSFLASSIVLFDVLYLSKRRGPITYMEWRTIAFGIVDLIQTSTWFLGNRKDHQGNLCRLQEYLFEASTLSKVFLCLVSSGILSYAVSARKLPDWQMIKFCEYGFVGLLSLLMVLLVSFDGSRPMCQMALDEGNFKDPSRLVFVLAYMMPLGITFFLTIFITIPSLFLHRAVAKTVLKSILDRLVTLPIIFTFCFLPPLILSILVVGFKNNSVILFQLSALCVSSSGSIFAGFHFYLKRKVPNRPLSTFANSVSGAGFGSETLGPMTISEQDLVTRHTKFEDSEYFGGE